MGGMFTIPSHGWLIYGIVLSLNHVIITQNNPTIIHGIVLPSGELTFCYGKSPFLMGKSTISMAIFNCYVSSPEGIHPHDTGAHLLEPKICQGQFQLLRHRLHRGRRRLARAEEVRSSEPLSPLRADVWAGNLLKMAIEIVDFPIKHGDFP